MKCFRFFVILLLLASGICSAASSSEFELFKAVTDSNVESVRALLDRGVSANARFRNEWTDYTVLMLSVTKDIALARMTERASGGKKGNDRNIEIVKLLLDHGADVNAQEKPSGMTALMGSVVKGQYEMAKILLERGADADAEAKAADGGTALALGLRTTREDAHPDVPSRLEMAQLLVKNGANVNAADNKGWTPLMIAIRERELPGEETMRLDLARFLIKSGATVNVAGKEYGETPLMLAAMLDEPEVVTALLGAGARVDSKNGHGFTALIAASGCGSVDSVSILIRKGADVRVKTREGLTPLRAAREWYEASMKDPDCGTPSGCDKPGKKARYSKIVRALKKAGAKE